jgi:hypothetical protein
MTATAGPCDAGFYCKNGSSKSQQIACPEGRYCEQGTHHPKPCPAGTFSNATMGKASSDCTQCTSGSYCETEGLTKPTGYCEAGYYCPRGSSNKTTIECPIGTHCPMGSAVFKYCSAGLYTDYAKASICHVCPEGFYCLPENVKPGMYKNKKILSIHRLISLQLYLFIVLQRLGFCNLNYAECIVAMLLSMTFCRFGAGMTLFSPKVSNENIFITMYISTSVIVVNNYAFSSFIHFHVNNGSPVLMV